MTKRQQIKKLQAEVEELSKVSETQSKKIQNLKHFINELIIAINYSNDAATIRFVDALIEDSGYEF